MKIITDVLRLLAVAAVVAVQVERPGEGAMKRAEAVELMKKILAEEGGVDIPAVVTPFQDWFLGLVIDGAVALLNRQGWALPKP